MNGKTCLNSIPRNLQMQIVRIFLVTLLILTASALTAQADPKPPTDITVSKPKVTTIPPSKNDPTPKYPDSSLDFSVDYPDAPNGLLVTTSLSR